MDRTCLHCDGPLPEGCQQNRKFCSRRCTNAFVYHRDPKGRQQAHKEWRDRTAEKRAAERLAAKPERRCAWCGEVLPASATARRRYCDITCKNRASVREKAAERAETNRKWCKANPERVLAWRHARRDRNVERMRRYYKENPHIFRELDHKRRARLAGVGGPGISQRDWQRLVNRFGGRCAYCGVSCKATMDHVVPISKGGWHAIGNILPACLPCNTSKSNRLLVEWRPHLQVRLRVLQSCA